MSQEQTTDLTRARTMASIDEAGVLVVHWTRADFGVLLCISDEGASYSIREGDGNFSSNITEFEIKDGWPDRLLSFVQDRE